VGHGEGAYSGRIFLHLNSGRSMELILLGKQDGLGIRDRLRTSTANRTN
jgi:hypothetical protein